MYMYMYMYIYCINEWCYTEGLRKFTKLLNFTKCLLSELRRVEKVLITGYLDDLITINL